MKKRKRTPINKDGYCACGCNRIASEYHEIFRGRNRQLSIDYDLVVALSHHCHEEITHNPFCDKDKQLREMGREYFEKTYKELDFIEIFK